MHPVVGRKRLNILIFKTFGVIVRCGPANLFNKCGSWIFNGIRALLDMSRVHEIGCEATSRSRRSSLRVHNIPA